MPQCVSLDQTVEFFRQVLRVISAALQGLCHQQNVKAQRVLLPSIVGEVALKQGVTDAVQFGIRAQDLACILNVEGNESAMNVFQHVSNDGRHLNQVPYVTSRKVATVCLYALRDSHDQIPNALEVGDALQAGQQPPSRSFVDARDGTR